MANNRNGLLRFANFIVWALFLCVEINAIDDFSGDIPYLKAMIDLPSKLESITNSSATSHTANANTTMSTRQTNGTMSPLATNSTRVSPTISLTNQTSNTTMSTRQTNKTTIHQATTQVFPTMSITDQPNSTQGHNTTLKVTPWSITKSTTVAMAAETTSQIRTDVYTTTMGISEDIEMTELKTKLNGYKIATISLAAILGIVFLIILIYFSARSKTGKGNITSPPSTPPEDEENFPQTEEFKPVRLSSYFPHADKSPLKFDLNENGDVEERKVTTFLTKKRQSLEDTTGSQDKILQTSEL